MWQGLRFSFASQPDSPGDKTANQWLKSTSQFNKQNTQPDPTQSVQFIFVPGDMKALKQKVCFTCRKKLSAWHGREYKLHSSPTQVNRGGGEILAWV